MLYHIRIRTDVCYFTQEENGATRNKKEVLFLTLVLHVLPPNNAAQTFPWLSCQLNQFHWNFWSVPSHRCISEWRWWLRSASISSCFVAARGRAMLFRIWRLSDSLLALAVTISTSKPFLDLKCMKCMKCKKKKGSGGNTLHKAHFECSNT